MGDRSDVVPGNGLRVVFVEFDAVPGEKQAPVMNAASNPV